MTMIEEVRTGAQVWRGIIAYENTTVGDGRSFGEFTWRDLPLPLKWQPTDLAGHEGSIIVGRIDRLWKENGIVHGEGVFDTSEVATEAARLVRDRMLRGVSVDPGGYEIEFTETDDGVEVSFPTYEIGAATLVPVPAFAGAWVALEGMPDPLPEDSQGTPASVDTAVVAAAPAPDAPPPEWFAPPVLARRTGLHVEADGRVYGHIYGWGECHLGSGPGRCVEVPRGGSYAHIIGVDGRGVLCSDGSHVQTGPISIAADHASLKLTWLAAKDHYAHTALAVADVACGEDEHGIWVAGMVRPGTPDELVHVLRASAPSGDWRAVGGRLALVAILSVNTPAFPALAASIGEDGAITALVASTGAAACGCGGVATTDLLERLGHVEAGLAIQRRVTAAARAQMLTAWEQELGVDRASRLAALDEILA